MNANLENKTPGLNNTNTSIKIIFLHVFENI